MTPLTFNDEFELFVPGRLCLFGAHSDWAGLYSTMNPKISVGRVIVTGIDQGIRAIVKPLENTFHICNVIEGEESDFSSDMTIDEVVDTIVSMCRQ